MYMCSGIAVDNSITHVSIVTDQALAFETPWYMDKFVSNLVNRTIFLDLQSISVRG